MSDTTTITLGDRTFVLDKEKADAAIAAKPDSLEELKKVAGPVFKTCKGCHEGYRVDKE